MEICIFTYKTFYLSYALPLHFQQCFCTKSNPTAIHQDSHLIVIRPNVTWLEGNLILNICGRNLKFSTLSLPSFKTRLKIKFIAEVQTTAEPDYSLKCCFTVDPYS